MHYVVGRIADSEGDKREMTFTQPFVATLANLTMQQFGGWGGWCGGLGVATLGSIRPQFCRATSVTNLISHNRRDRRKGPGGLRQARQAGHNQCRRCQAASQAPAQIGVAFWGAQSEILNVSALSAAR